MIAVNNWRDSVSLPPLAAKPKKGKSQTVTSTLPKSQGPEASESLSKKSKIPKDIQLASTRLPFTLDEGTHKLQSLLESTATHHKDSGGNKQPLDRDITSMTPDEGTAKTTLCPEASLRDKDLGGNIPPTDMEPIHNLVVILQGLVLNISISGRRLESSLIESLRNNRNIMKKQESPMLTLRPPLKNIMKKVLLIEIRLTNLDNNDVKDNPATNKKYNATIKNFAKSSAQTTEILSLVKNFDFSTLQNLGSRMTAIEISHTALKRKVSFLRHDTSKIKSMMAEIYQSFKVISHPESSQATLRINKVKGITTESKEDPSKKLVPASTIICPDPDKPVRVEFMINGKIVISLNKKFKSTRIKRRK
nr:hypothetical protein [Tanacetum cinerariifolium]